MQEIEVIQKLLVLTLLTVLVNNWLSNKHCLLRTFIPHCHSLWFSLTAYGHGVEGDCPKILSFHKYKPWRLIINHKSNHYLRRNCWWNCVRDNIGFRMQEDIQVNLLNKASTNRFVNVLMATSTNRCLAKWK